MFDVNHTTFHTLLIRFNIPRDNIYSNIYSTKFHWVVIHIDNLLVCDVVIRKINMAKEQGL